eukprot:jgi/Chlat1/7593/Chrsp63S07090
MVHSTMLACGVLVVLFFSCLHVVSGLCPFDSAYKTLTPWSQLFKSKSISGGVTLKSGQNVLFDVEEVTINSGITIAAGAVLVFKDAPATLTTDFIAVQGALHVGGEGCPFVGKLTVNLAGTALVPGIAGSQLHGAKGLAQSWTKLAATASVGTKSVAVIGSVSSWKAGDAVSEVRKIASIAGQTIVVDAPLKWMHYGQVTYGVDERAEVALLSRSIEIVGGAPIGCHTIFVKGFKAVHVQAVAVINGGQGDAFAKYPIHFHVCGRVPTGTYVRDCVASNSNFRAYVIHGTQGVALSGNVAFNTQGHAFLLEDGAEFGNNTGARLGSDADAIAVSAFWITNGNNVFNNNVASGCQGTGFWFQTRGAVEGLSGLLGLYGSLNPAAAKFAGFTRNVAHSCARGLNVESGILDDNDVGYQFKHANLAMLAPSDGTAPNIQDFQGWKLVNSGLWGRLYKLTLTRCIWADTPEGVQIAGRGGHPDPGLSMLVGNVFVGRSGNPGNPVDTSVSNSIVGYRVYDGPQSLDGCTFINYNGAQCTPLEPRVYNVFFMHTSTNLRAAKFVNSPVHIRNSDVQADGGKTTNIYDADGSLTGHAGAVVLPLSWNFYKAPGCINDGANGLICPQAYANAEVQCLSSPCANPNSLHMLLNNRVSSDNINDGELVLSGNAGTWQPIWSVGASYLLVFDAQTPQLLQLQLDNAYQGEWVELGVCYPPDTVIISVQRGLGLYSDGVLAQLAQANTLANQRASNANAYYWDVGRGLLVVTVKQRGQRYRDIHTDPDEDFCPGTGCDYVVIDLAAPGQVPSPRLIMPTPPPKLPGRCVLISAGSNSGFTDFSGDVWKADDYYQGGATASAGSCAMLGAKVGLEQLYKSYRYGSFSYTVPVATAGSYTVTLHFAETYWHESGQRVFDIKLQGATVLPNFDIVAAAKGPFTAVVKSFNVVVQNKPGQAIAISLVASKDSALVCAIQVCPQQ